MGVSSQYPVWPPAVLVLQIDNLGEEHKKPLQSPANENSSELQR
jgi:hypothetical protein